MLACAFGAVASYNQALEAVEFGRQRVLAAGVKFDRPNDYFAEMVKSDDHMARIRQRLANESARIKRSEEAAKQRALKKYGKQAQAEKLQERAKAKSAELEKIKMIRKGASEEQPLWSKQKSSAGLTHVPGLLSAPCFLARTTQVGPTFWTTATTSRCRSITRPAAPATRTTARPARARSGR